MHMYQKKKEIVILYLFDISFCCNKYVVTQITLLKGYILAISFICVIE